MTVKQLIEALAEYPDDAYVDVRLGDGDANVTEIVAVTTVTFGRNKGTWVTLGLEG